MNRLLVRALPTNLVPSSDVDRPSRLILSIIDEFGSDKELLRIECDARELIEWFIENQVSIRKELLPNFLALRHSIASTLLAFYDEVEKRTDSEVDETFEYRRRHGLRFGMRGVDAPDIYIGVLAGEAEISLADGLCDWRHSFDLDDFYANLPVHLI